MRRTSIPLVCVAALAAVPGLEAGAAAGPGAERHPGPVSVRVSSPVVVEAGRSADAGFMVEIAEGFHIQANPASDRFLIPAELKLGPARGIEPGVPAYPQGRPHRLEGASTDISTYEEAIRILVPLQADEAAELGDRLLRGTLRYQACDARRCFPPALLPVEVAVRIVPASEPERPER